MRDNPEVRSRAAHLPDEPGWVDFRGMLLSGACEVRGGRRDYVVVSRIYPVCAVVGKPKPEVVRRALRSLGGRVHLISRDAAGTCLGRSASRWKRRLAILHIRPERDGKRGLDPATRRLTSADRELLRATPKPLRSEIIRNLDRCVTVAYFLGRKPVSFAYACWETERWFDIAVDTLKAYRRRGYAAACVRRLIAEMRRRGRRPVWGASEDNPASLRLASKLGFQPVDRLWVFTGRP